MTTPRKKWPHTADWARMDSITLARKGRKDLLEIVDQIDNTTVLRTIVKTIETLREIEQKLNDCKTKGTQND